jgi:hypothetical protein
MGSWMEQQELGILMADSGQVVWIAVVGFNYMVSVKSM